VRVQLDPEDDPSVWNQDDADWLVGKYALIGITHVAADGETVTGQDQYHGRIESADSEKGIEMVCEGRWSGQKMMLPPDLAAFHPAEPGEYRLKSSTDVVIDPDVLGSWSIVEPASALLSYSTSALDRAPPLAPC
jgi:hypothetical protein